MPPTLPGFVPPMLASIGKPFDSEEHLFELKWDGIRALGFVEDANCRLLSRRQTDLTPRYPELECLARLPEGLVLDGELVVLTDGIPDFSLVMRREQVRSTLRIGALARALPVTYVVFDLLYAGHRSVMDLPLVRRRAMLSEIVEEAGEPALVFSEGIVGGGRAYFDEVLRLGVEGMVAKRLEGRYLPGGRTTEWQKVKPVQALHCAILGYVPEGAGDLKSLVIAAEEGGELRCVGKVGSGLSRAMREGLVRRFANSRRDEPLVSCDFEGVWVEPSLYCTVSFFERTKRGMLRAPVFVGLVEEGS